MLNNFESNNPMGVAIYANAIDIIKSLDNTFDSLVNEFVLGRKRIFVDSSIVNVDNTSGEIVPLFDPSDTVFYGIPGMSGDDGKSLPIKESDMTLRVKDHVDAIQTNLDLLSLKAGFGRGFYRFETMQVTTATEVISTDSKMYRRIRKDEIPLEVALRNMAKVALFFGGFDPEVEITVKFDDSVIEDSNAIAQRCLQEYQAGVISLEVYYERVDKLRERAAKAMAKRIRKELEADAPEPDPVAPAPAGASGAGDGGAYKNSSPAQGTK
jgi:A118 family predicted phage portal protein